MKNPVLISVVVPTVDGREDYLERGLAWYGERTAADVELIVVRNRPTVGEAWQEGSELSTGEYVHFTADDLEPLQGWDIPARETCNAGGVPAPVIWHKDREYVESTGGYSLPKGNRFRDGEPTDNVSVVPFYRRDQWELIGPSLPLHMYSDNWLTDRARLAGFPIIVRLDFAFRHHWAQPGRGAGMTEVERMAHDRRNYEKACRGEWP